MKIAMFFIILMSCFFVIYAMSLTILILFNFDNIDDIDSRMIVLAISQVICIIVIALIFAAVGVVNFIKYV